MSKLDKRINVSNKNAIASFASDNVYEIEKKEVFSFHILMIVISIINKINVERENDSLT